jgi:prepilin-type N-terminal cleavage/methylation domain-containing protein
MTRWGGDDGFTLVELIIGMTLMLIVIGATLGVLAAVQNVSRLDTDQNAAQDAARTALDAIARDLRNVAEPSPALGTPPVAQPTIERATADDIVLRNVDATGGSGDLNTYRVRRIRYCLSAQTDGTANLWQQTQTWTTQAAPGMPSVAACNGTGWPRSRVLADHVTNHLGGRTDRPAFSFNPTSFSDPKQIKALRPELWIAATPGSREARLTTAYYLRNQNEPPVSDAVGSPFTVTVNATGVVLNAFGFEDPEGGALTYVWYDTPPDSCRKVSDPPPPIKIGSGISLSYPACRGQHQFSLTVLDDKLLGTEAPAQVVNVT